MTLSSSPEKEYSYNLFGNGLAVENFSPGLIEATQRLKKKYNEPARAFGIGVYGWIQAEAFVQAIKKAQSVLPEKILAAFDSMTKEGSFNTSFGPAHMGGAERFGVDRVLIRPLPLLSVEKGNIKFEGFKMPVTP